ncbi:MAG: hypothetical protein L0Y58_18990, partial [Verrucomicrobia subdivision 3 bacterium]|nr:hypothetical protein [Limisphaerales bacterium]
FSVIPTVFREMAKFVHFIRRKSLLFSHPLLITPVRCNRNSRNQWIDSPPPIVILALPSFRDGSRGDFTRVSESLMKIELSQ